MPTEPVRVYWDSCVYIDLIQRKQNRYPTLRKIVQEAESGKIVFVASSLVFAEVFRLKSSVESLDRQVDLIRGFFENDFFAVKDIDRAIAEQAADICRQHNVKPPDAIHLATAMRWSCTCLQTYDGMNDDPASGTKTKRLLFFDGKIGRPPLKIEVPRCIFPQEPRLFDPRHPESPGQNPQDPGDTSGNPI